MKQTTNANDSIIKSILDLSGEHSGQSLDLSLIHISEPTRPY